MGAVPKIVLFVEFYERNGETKLLILATFA